MTTPYTPSDQAAESSVAAVPISYGAFGTTTGNYMRASPNENSSTNEQQEPSTANHQEPQVENREDTNINDSKNQQHYQPNPAYQEEASKQHYSPRQTLLVGRKKRLCSFPGCSSVVKSQGRCQLHGAKAKRCSVERCDKQAQTTHEGSFFVHFIVEMCAAVFI